MSDTPRTDKVTRIYGDASVEWEEELVPVDACRAIERELNSANEKAQRYYEAILKHKAENEHLTKKIHQLYEGAEEQKQRIKHLIELGLETSDYGLQTHREMWEKEARK